MKTTYLIYKDINAAEKELRVASQQEWDEILKNNKGLSMERRRHFIRDSITESDGLDNMFIEVSLEEYKKWHSKQVYKERLRKIGMTISKISLDAEVEGAEGGTLSDTISDGKDYEKQVISKLMMEQLREKLSQWKPWANELLNLYLDRDEDSATELLCKRLGCSEQYARRMKREFSSLINIYLKN